MHYEQSYAQLWEINQMFWNQKLFNQKHSSVLENANKIIDDISTTLRLWPMARYQDQDQDLPAVSPTQQGHWLIVSQQCRHWILKY